LEQEYADFAAAIATLGIMETAITDALAAFGATVKDTCGAIKRKVIFIIF